MKHLLSASLFALALAGCASAPTTTAANDNSVTCERETPTGSMLSKSKCRSAEQKEADRAGVAATAEAIRNQRNLPPGK